MATDRYSIKVDAGQAITAINSLRGALGGLASAFAITEITKFADAVTNVRNKLALLDPNIKAIDASFNRLIEVSNRSRTSLEATSDLYFRISRSAKDLGITQADAASITETVAKAITASGISAQEAAGPLLQLGQALQSGRLQGDELRSILEGLPPVSNALAKSLGVPVGALRELGAAGIITSRDVVRALQEAKASIDRDFANTNVTIGQSFTVLQNNIARTIADLDKVSGTSNSVAQAIISIAKSFEGLTAFIKNNGAAVKEFISLIGNLALIFGSLFVITKILSPLTKFFEAVTLGKASTTALGTAMLAFVSTAKDGIALLVAGFSGLMKILSMTGGFFSNLRLLLVAILGGITRLVPVIGLATAGFTILNSTIKILTGSSLIDWIQSGINKLKELGKQLLGIGDGKGPKFLSAEENDNELKRLQNRVASATADMANKAASTNNAFDKLFDKDFSKFLNGFKETNKELLIQAEIQKDIIGLSDSQKSLVDAQVTALRPYNDALKQLREQYNQLAEAARIAGEGSVDAAKFEAFKAGYPARVAQVTKEYQKTSAALNELAMATEKATRANNLRLFNIQSEIAFSEELQKIQDDIAKMGMSEIEQKYYDIEAAANASARAAIRAEEARRGTRLDPEEVKQYYEAARKGSELLKIQTQELYENSRKFSTGWKNAFRDYVDNATNAAKRAENAFRKFTQGLEDLIVNFAKTGKFEWKQFVASMLEELLRSQIQVIFAQLMGAMGDTLKSSGGGLIDSIMGIFGAKRGDGGFLDTIVGGIGSIFGGGGGGTSVGQSANNPMYVYDVSGGGGGGGILGDVMGGGTQGQQGGGIWEGIKNTAGKVWEGIKNTAGTVWEGIKSVGSGVWEGIKTVGGGVWEGIKSVGSAVGDIFGIGSSSGSSGGGLWDTISSIGSSIGDFFGGFFANGGTLGAGKWGIAGENGPEIIRGPASITPMGGSTMVTYNINAVDAMSFKQLLAQDPSFIYGLTMQGSKGVALRR